MRSLAKPNEKPLDVFKKCISNIRDQDFKERLKSSQHKIDDFSIEYEASAFNNLLHQLPTHEQELYVTKEEMVKIYDTKFVPKGQPGREVYDKLMIAPKFGRCPLCGQGIVTTLDHHLPKTKYPALAVTPSNLIPACYDCNRVKESIIPNSKEEETLHPYFDDFNGEKWLFAVVEEGDYPSVTFKICVPNNWDSLIEKRIEKHFQTFQLYKMYSSYAAEEVADKAYQLCNTYSSGGETALRSHLFDSAKVQSIII